MKSSGYVSEAGFQDTGMIFKFIHQNNEFIHIFSEGELLYKMDFLKNGLIGKTLYELYPDNTNMANSLNAHYEKAWKGHFVQYEGEYKEIQYITYLRPLFSEGNVVEVVGTCIDITKRKKMEEDIRQKENLYRTILETMTEAVLIEEEGQITALNESANKMLGIKTVDFTEGSMKKLGWEYIKENGSPISISELIGLITLQHGRRVKNVVLGVKGENIGAKWLSVNSSPLTIPGKYERASLITISEMTLQKKQEKKLMHSYVFQRNLIDQLDRGIVMTDRNKKIRLMNKKFYEMFSLEGGIDLYIGQYAAQLHHLFDEKIETERHGNLKRPTKEIKINQHILLRCNCSALIEENEICGYIWDFEDVTERNKMERTIIQAKEEAEKANVAKSDFLSKMSHELRTPLNGILGFAQLLELEEGLTETQYDFVQEILNGGRHLLELVNEVLDLSRIETGNLKVTIDEVNLLTVINECINIVQPLAKKKGIRIDHKLTPLQNTLVFADPVRLKQILLNLLDNAIKYNIDDGEVSIRCYQEGSEQVVHIVDTGIGLSKDEYHKIFVPFYRIGDSKEGGTGIGLSLVKQLVHLMGGEINITSKIGKGSDFSFSLPVPTNLKAAVRWGEEVDSHTENENKIDNYRLLYIEDNKANFDLVSNILKSQPSFTLLPARTGKEGLERAKENIDLILLDINLPDINGYEVFDMLKKNKETKDIAVIAVSANAMPQDIQCALAKGFDSYVTKPINIKEFLTVVQETLNKTIYQNIPDHTILSTGPYGEEAISAKTLQLSLEELKEIKKKKYKAAIAMHYSESDWSKSQVEGVKATFEKMGIEVVAVTDAQFNWEKQVADIEAILTQKPDILASIPVNPARMANIYKKAAEENIKLVFMDNIPKNLKHERDYVSVVSSDNYGNGIESAHVMAEQLSGQGNVGIIYLESDFFATKQRTEAFEKTIKEYYPNIQIVDRMGIESPNEGQKAAAAMLAKHQDLNGIFVVWDVPAEGALKAARTAERNDLVITTIDLGLNVAAEIARGGLIKGLGAQLPYQQGVAEAILAGYALIGKHAPPYVAVPALRVTKENILDAWKLVYNEEAPTVIQEAVDQENV
ncbi:substrate-binding domain-containing protein [Domibacillus enclensis]|uniref:histidine kinase n=1 Tax=Domibacillus enclensis TaxID=1017273 RepID=A0A1N6W700_9BACI|nr:substrate-binding domain-containing protein [Domibacillus enclensis]OXS77864.1 histidine kinase [Domibacillus enclensis]SIQ85911.1 ribose transport system substrate-binding protein [Domibacillus enclensis]